MASVYDKVKEEGITLPAPPPKGGAYIPVRGLGTNLLYCSGYGPDLGGGMVIGKLGRDLIVEEEQKVTYNCALNFLANIEAKVGNLNKIKRFVKVLAFVNSADDLVQQPQAMNDVPSSLVELFGEEIGCSVCSAVGTNALPDDIACEIEVLLEVEA